MKPELMVYGARIAAIEARIAGMLAMNTTRTMRGETIAYAEDHFFDAERELEAIAEEVESKFC
jgi:hypothetical protein